MNQPSPNYDSSNAQNLDDTAEDREIEQAIADLEQSLQSLKERYIQIQQDQQQQVHLQQRVDQLSQQFKQQPQLHLKAELAQLQEQLDTLEVNLESRLLSWKSFREPFWQVVRFGGVGLLLGWVLAFIVFKSPQPTPTQFAPTNQQTQF
jgi:flagellar biosynthesis GTPase FlhF